MTKIAPTFVGLALALCASSVAAQTTKEVGPESTTQASDTGDIVVTATRSETFLSKTPIAVTALNAEQLTRGGVTDATQLQTSVPNLQVSRTGNGGYLQVTIRGITSGDTSEKGDPSVSFMSDGIYIARPYAQDVALYDLNRIEVLRGPQGTLFGRNTTAGVIQVVSNKPRIGEFSGSLDASLGNYGARNLTGALNIPVNDGVALRAAFNYERRDSYLKAGPNFTAGLSPFRDNISGRLSALFKLSDRGELTLRGDYSSMKGKTENLLPLSNAYVNTTTALVAPTYIGDSQSVDKLYTMDRTFSGNLDRNNNTWGLSADFQYDLGPVTLNYLGSYRKLRLDQNLGYVRSNGSVYEAPFTGDFWQNSQEVRLSTNDGGPLKLQAGAFYFKEKSDIFLYLKGFLSATPNTTGYIYGFDRSPTITESYAGFGQATYDLTDNFHVTGGLRYSHDRKSRDGATVRCSTAACDLPTDTRQPDNADRAFSKVTWRAGIDWDASDRTLIYATASTGYKAGGFNDGCEIGTGTGCTFPRAALYYEPETITAYEIGAKMRTADNSLKANLSAFHYDYKNLQLSQVTTVCGAPCNVISNAAIAKVDGVEAEATITPVKAIRVDLSATYLNARYGDFFPNKVTQPTLNFSGRPLDRSPKWVATAGFTYRLELGNGSNIEANVRTRLSDDYYMIALGTLNQFRVPSYTTTDFSLTYNIPDSGFYAQAFLKNAENNVVPNAVAVGTFATVQLTDPRTFGGRIGIRF